MTRASDNDGRTGGFDSSYGTWTDEGLEPPMMTNAEYTDILELLDRIAGTKRSQEWEGQPNAIKELARMLARHYREVPPRLKG